MNLIWFRNDLRLDDNPALFQACESGSAVRAIYIATAKTWQGHHIGQVQLGFKQAVIRQLAQQLATLGIELDYVELQSFEDCADYLLSYCQQYSIDRLYFNAEIPLDETRRDKLVCRHLHEAGIDTWVGQDDCLFSGDLLNKQGLPYKVFTPWYRQWLHAISACPPMALAKPEPIAHSINPISADVQLPGAGEFRQDLWLSEESQVLDQLQTFCQQGAFHYMEVRDIPSVNGTSTLSPYLAIGLLSPRRCFQQIQRAYQEQGKDWRESDWLRELAWRDFYRYLLKQFPHLSRGENFKQDFPNHWLSPEDKITAWQRGQTGFPIIDAAMVQLLRTGWMHNRLRMVVASFYCKLLCADWRGGEAFFMQHLVDADFASNNGGWQWSSATGCDASPWFRIFNPTSQSQKFDAEGQFIRKMLPQLSDLDNKSIHKPSSQQRAACDYPEPIIDYKSSRQAALNFFKSD